MADLDKVLKGLEHCGKNNGASCWFGCPYFRGTDVPTCGGELQRDAHELLKSQQAKIERLKAEVEKAREKGFTAGQNNVFEAQNEGW